MSDSLNLFLLQGHLPLSVLLTFSFSPRDNPLVALRNITSTHVQGLMYIECNAACHQQLLLVHPMPVILPCLPFKSTCLQHIPGGRKCADRQATTVSQKQSWSINPRLQGSGLWNDLFLFLMKRIRQVLTGPHSAFGGMASSVFHLPFPFSQVQTMSQSIQACPKSQLQDMMFWVEAILKFLRSTRRYQPLAPLYCTL